VAVDAASGADSAPLEAALRLAEDGGTVIVQNAYHPGVVLPTALREIFRRSISVIGSFSYCQRHQPDDFADALSLLETESTRVANLVVSIGQLTELSVGLAGKAARAVRAVLTSETSIAPSSVLAR
jgi:threonine dehydrogenase-like Zn-dependent dehydrogenase